MLARIGVKVDLLAQTKSKYFAKVLAQNGYDTSFYLLGWTPSTFDAHNAIVTLMACRVDGKGSFNLGGYCNERVTELADLIQVETEDRTSVGEGKRGSRRVDSGGRGIIKKK